MKFRPWVVIYNTYSVGVAAEYSRDACGRMNILRGLKQWVPARMWQQSVQLLNNFMKQYRQSNYNFSVRVICVISNLRCWEQMRIEFWGENRIPRLNV